MQRRQLGAGLDAELVAQPLAGALVRQQRVGLPPTAIQGDQQQAHRALAPRPRDGERLEAGDGLSHASQRQRSLRAQLAGGEAGLIQARGLGRQQRPALDVGVGRPSPPRQRRIRVGQRRGGVASGGCRAGGGRLDIERGGIDGELADQRIASGAVGHRRAQVLQRTPQARRVRLQRGGPAGSRAFDPQLDAQALHRQRSTLCRQQRGEQRARLGTTQWRCGTDRAHLQRSQHTRLHGLPFL